MVPSRYHQAEGMHWKKVEIWEENGEVGDCHLVALCGGLLMVTVYTIL